MKHIKLPLLLEPIYRDYIWGGERLKPGFSPIAEQWAVYESNKILNGRYAGKTLAEVTAECSVSLLGNKFGGSQDARFPLLIKLLDCNQWLSLQVHPNDAKAIELEGPGQVGKSEAWYFIDADTQAEILCWVKPGMDKTRLKEVIREKKLLDNMERLKVKTGQVIFIPAGMVHALGPGLLVYEVQQSSDITYRVWDWDRPDNGKRPLHIDKSIAAANPDFAGRMINPDLEKTDLLIPILSCDYFNLSLIHLNQQSLVMDPAFETFQVLTVIEGSMQLKGTTWNLTLDPFQTALVPADAGRYEINSTRACKALCAMNGEAYQQKESLT